MVVEETLFEAGDGFVFSVGEEALVFVGTVTGAVNKNVWSKSDYFRGFVYIYSIGYTVVPS